LTIPPEYKGNAEDGPATLVGDARVAGSTLSAEARIAPPAAPEIASASLELPRMVRALRHRDFRYFWMGNFLSNIGTWMQNVAQGWLVLQLSNSAFWLGMVGFAAAAPMLVFALIGGVIADHADKRRLLLTTQSAMMIFAFLLALLSSTQLITVPQIVVLAFATGLAMSLNSPAYQALVPQLVSREDLVNAIALNSAQFNMSRVLGPTLGGFAMAWIGVSGNFFLNGLSFLAVIFALLQIRYPAQRRNWEGSLWQPLREGFRYVGGNREMVTLVLMAGCTSLLAVPYLTFIPLFARDILQVGERGLGGLMAFSGLGAFLGAITIAYLGRVRRRGRFMALSGSAFFVAIALFSFSRWFLVSSALQVLAGYSMILMVATLNTMMQHLSSDEMRGRVMSIYTTAYLGLAPLGSLTAGLLSRLISAPHAIAAMAMTALAWFAWLYATRPELRRLD